MAGIPGLTAAVVLLGLIQAGFTCYLFPMPPKITFPAERTIQVPLGSTFKLTCTNVFRLRWQTPTNDMDRTTIKEESLAEEGISLEFFESVFTRTAAVPEDSGYYNCIQLGQDILNTTSDKIYVNVTDKPEENVLLATEEKPQERVRLSYEFKDGNFEVTCRALLDHGMRYHVFWQGPSAVARQKGQIHLQRQPQEMENGTRVAVHKLTVLNVNKENDGLYTCTLAYNTRKEYSASLSLSGHDVQVFGETSNELKQV